MENNYESKVAWSEKSVSSSTARFMSRVYGWMTLGILMSGIVAWQVSENAALMMDLLQNRAIFYAVIILQIGLVMVLSAAINRLSSFVAGLMYFTFSAVMGVSMSFIFLMYTQGSIYSMFFLTAFSFAGLSSFGYVTKRDLGPVGSFCAMGLFGMVGYSILSMFFPSMMGGSANLFMGIIGVVVFSGLTAYDTQKVKTIHQMGNEGTESDKKGAIIGALTLYLDFINLFMSLLRIFGRRR